MKLKLDSDMHWIIFSFFVFSILVFYEKGLFYAVLGTTGLALLFLLSSYVSEVIGSILGRTFILKHIFNIKLIFITLLSAFVFFLKPNVLLQTIALGSSFGVILVSLIYFLKYLERK